MNSLKAEKKSFLAYDEQVEEEDVVNIENLSFSQNTENDIESSVAKSESAEETYNKGIECYNGKDYVKAYDFLKKAADEEDSRAQYKLGDMYYYGVGVTQDYKKSCEWYKKLQIMEMLRRNVIWVICMLAVTG